jgi:hypothetical protein
MNVIVYHIFCVGDYLDVVNSQIEKLKVSGLYNWCDTLEVSCVDTEDKYEGIDEIFNGMDKVNLFKTNRNAYEYWGINKVWELSQQHDGKVFYFHAKGVSNTYKNLVTKETSNWKVEGIKIWRDALEHHLIDNFQKCVLDLDEYDTCGMTCVGNWFWGNFWWANLSFVRKNNKPVHGDRWYFEDWLHHARHYKAKEYFHFEWNPYFSNLPVEAYYNQDFFKGKKIEVLSGLFGTTGIQQDEGYPPEIPIHQVDVTEKIIDNLKSNNGQLINLRVDTNVMGEPIHGMRKFLVMMIRIDDDVYRITYNENFNVGLKFN